MKGNLSFQKPVCRNKSGWDRRDGDEGSMEWRAVWYEAEWAQAT